MSMSGIGANILGYADPDKLGIAGASYGGWVTAFAITQTDRFKAASAHDPVIDSGVASAAAYRGKHLSNYWMHSGLFASSSKISVFTTSCSFTPRCRADAAVPPRASHA